jgi:hypothetical protein
MDYVRRNLDLVKAGEVYGLVAQPLYEDLAAALAKGKKAPTSIRSGQGDYLCRPRFLLRDTRQRGLLGAGRTELLSAIYGHLPHSGRIFVEDREWSIASTRDVAGLASHF